MLLPWLGNHDGKRRGRINPKQHLGKHCGGKSHWLKMLNCNALWVRFAKSFMVETHDGFPLILISKKKPESYNRH